jgi:hypothetical protein
MLRACCGVYVARVGEERAVVLLSRELECNEFGLYIAVLRYGAPTPRPTAPGA